MRHETIKRYIVVGVVALLVGGLAYGVVRGVEYLNGIHRELETARQLNDILGEQLDTLSRSLDSASTRNRQLTGKLETIRDDLGSARREIAELRKSNQSLRDEAQLLRGNLDRIANGVVESQSIVGEITRDAREARRIVRQALGESVQDDRDQ